MRYLLLLFFLALFASMQSQTLYWVGGSGNFSDGKHWSLSSGGAAANKIPNSNTDVIFENTSGNGNVVINIVGQNSIKSAFFNNDFLPITFTGSKFSELNISGSFQLNNTTSFLANSSLVFSSVSFGYSDIRFGNKPYNGDVTFKNGNWNLKYVNIGVSNTLNFKSGNYNINGSAVKAGNLISNNGEVNFQVNKGLLEISNEITIGANTKFNSDNLVLKARQSDLQKYHVAPNFNFGNNPKITDLASMMVTCGATLTSTGISCSGICDGAMVLTIDPGCGPGPYNLTWNNGGVCPLPTLAIVPGGGSYTISGLCACADFYGVDIDNGGFPFATPSPTNIAGVSAIVFNTFVPVQPTCFGLCNGSVVGNLTGGVQPYTVTVNGGLNGTYPGISPGVLTYSNLCAGVSTFVIVDAVGCIRTKTVNLNQPAAIVSNSVVTNVACFGQCTGVFSVSPTGGTAGYTVNFSPGGTVAVGGGGTVGIGGLCNGATASSTITDANGCTVTTSPISITQPPAITITPTQTNVTCVGGSNGVASVSVSGGVAPYVFVWNPGPGGNTATIGGLPVGTQTVTITNNGGACSNTQTFNIVGPSAFTITPSLTNISCNGLCNGSASLVLSGGNGAPYGFTWSPVPGAGQGTGTISSLCPNSYTATISDGLGCFTTAIVTVTAPPAYTLTSLTQSITCFGQCTGAASITIAGNNGAPYNIVWSPVPPSGQGTGTISNLCVGDYTANITDGIGCPTNIAVSITQPASITLNVNSTSITCNGLCNGVITSTPAGGIAPYSFTLVTPAAASVVISNSANATYNGLCVGVHTLFVAASNGCLQNFTVNIQQPNPLVPSVVSTSVSCFNGCNGTLAGNVIGGTPGYTLVWTVPGPFTVAGGALAGQCAGTYTLNITDANNCTTNTVVVLNQPTAITATITPTNPTCPGLCNGILTAVVAGGTPIYTLNWSNGFVGNPNSGLCAGPYTLTVTDANNCIQPFTATLTPPPAITVNVVAVGPVCSGFCNGTATVTALGGAPAYTFQFNTFPVTTNTTGVIAGLCPGPYIVTVNDANGCSQPQNFNITNPPVLSAAVTSVQTSCNACTGAATVTPAGGTGTYAVVWTNTLGVVVGNAVTVNGLCPGNYTATITDAAGCVTNATVNILQTVNVVIIVGGTPIQCFGACTGSAVATAVGGTLPYSYSWSPTGQITQTATGLCAGDHTVLVTDALGCSNTGTVNLANPPAIVVNTAQTNVTCFGNCNGVITTTASGGTGALTYSWSPGGQVTTSLSGLCAAGYTLVVNDANNCSNTSTFNVTQSPSLAATFTVTQPSACIANNGSICVTPSGGNGGPYTFTWSPVGGNASCATGLGAGAYSVTISDGVCSTTLTALLTNPSGPTLTVLSQSISCFGGNNGAATVTAAGIAAFGFTWSPVVPFITLGNVSTAGPLLTGTYNISVSDGNGCITSQTVSIAQPSSLTVNSAVTDPKCFAQCNGSITLGLVGGTPAYSLNWLPGVIVGQGTQTVTNLCAGPYTVNITDANLCVQSRTFNLVAPSAITLTNIPSQIPCNGVCNGSIVANAIGGTAPLSYVWPPVGGFTGSLTASVNGLCPNTYTVNVTDGNGCLATNTIAITQPAALTSTLNFLGVTCSNSCNATATLSGGGGTPTFSFSWSGSPVTTSTIANLCAGAHSGTITDGNGCTTIQSFTVNAPVPFAASVTPTQPLCNGSCNGSITTTLTGAQGTVSFVWLPTGVGQNPTNLCANNYTLTAIDANSCQANVVTTLIDPPAVLANVTTTNPSCFGSCNGVAISNATNVTLPVTYVWTPAAPNSATINALCANNYTLVVTDNNGCQDTQTFTLTPPPVLNVNPAVAPATCGSPNGSITVVPVGGTPAYTYTWSAPIVSNASVVVGLPAGIYTVVVQDFNGCTNTVSIPLSNSNGPSAAPITSSSITCFGQATGAASVNIGTIAGGTPTYAVNWVSPPSPTTVNPQVNLIAGTYTAQVVDQLGCIFFTAVTIGQASSVNIVPSFTLPTCNGVCNGSITLNTAGGTPAYQYTWSPGVSATATLNNACAGNYTIQILDNNNCLSTQTLNLAPALNMAATTSTTQNNCFNSCNATATLTSILGGFPPYVASWSNGQSGNVATNLCNGIYTVTVLDANSCFNSFTAAIVSPAQITATTSIASPSCNMCNGSSTVVAGGGTAPFTYSWTSGANGTTASSLCAGLYQVLITDNFGCTQTQNVAISNSNGITGETFSLQPIACAGICNGGATVTPIGGTAPITYSWIAPSSTISSVNGLCTGTYVVQMTDAAGCIRTSSTSISAATEVTLSPFINQPTCGSSNGTINVIASGGVPNYTYAWTPPAGNTPSLTGVGPGSYSVIVTDANGCSKNQVFTISNANAPIITFTQSNIGCFNACTGSIVALGTTTSNPVTYTWGSGANTPTASALCKGIITLTVTALNGCMAIQSFTLTDNPAMQLSISNIQELKCNGDCNGAITLIPSGGTLPYSFTWSPAGNVNPLIDLCAGTYTGTVTDAKGCSTLTSVTFTNPPLLVLTNTLTNSSCNTIADGSASVNLAGGTPSFSFNWTGPAPFTASTQVVNNILAGDYTVVVTDSRGCNQTNTLQIVSTITVIANAGKDSTFCTNNSIDLDGTNSIGANTYSWYELPIPSPTLATTSTLNVTPVAGTSTYVLQVISSVPGCMDFDTVVVNSLALPIVSAGPSYTIPVFSSVVIGGNPTAPTGITYTWSPSFTLDNISLPNPTASNTVNTTYTITVTDINGCVASDTMRVFLYPEIKIPNGFSPNGDSKNDKWIIDNLSQFPDCVMEIYNRWGELLFISRGYTVPFDGLYKGKDLPVGTYYYVLNLNHPAYPAPYTGPLTIFR